MRRRIRPTVECLEGKALLSGAPAGLAVTLNATPMASSSGTQVALTLTETNVSHQDVTVDDGPSLDGFSAARDGKTVWVSNPGINAMFIRVVTLKPGESFTIHATWDGRSNQVDPLDSSTEGPRLSGTFTIRNGLDQDGPSATVKLGADPAPKPTHITPPRPTHRIG
jgi:hypothetical protein